METLVKFLSEDTNITLAEDLSESMAGMLEYTNEFSQLSNARMPPPPCMAEVRLSLLAVDLSTSPTLLSELFGKHMMIACIQECMHSSVTQ